VKSTAERDYSSVFQRENNPFPRFGDCIALLGCGILRIGFAAKVSLLGLKAYKVWLLCKIFKINFIFGLLFDVKVLYIRFK
jgi:hypothetical protein